MTIKVALVQCPAWGILPPLGAASLKSYLALHDVESQCFDFNLSYYHEEQRAREADTSGAYGGTDPWGTESFDQWGIDNIALVQQREVRFLPDSDYNHRPLPIERWAEEVLAWNPDVIGITVYVTSFVTSLLLARELKRRAPEVTIAFGGPHVASDQSGASSLMTGIPDVVVDGEGEETLLDIVHTIEAGSRDLSQIAGAGTLVDGEVSWGPKRPLIRKIDDLPFPDFSDFDLESYLNPYVIPIMSSRGCVLHCSFCYETVYWKRFRTQSPQRIADEIAYQIERHPLRERAERDGSHFYMMFADSLVNGHLGGLRRFADLMIERDLPVRWGGQATINTKMDAAFFTKLRAAGCTGLAFGLESGSQRVLASMGKHFDIDDAADFLKQAHLAGVLVTANVMVGYPNETTRDFIETLRFLARTRRWMHQVSNVTTTGIALGSDLHTFPEKYGVTVHDDGSWTSEATGDDLTRDRRLHVLHLWMRLLRIPHQKIAAGNRRQNLRRRRAERRARHAADRAAIRARAAVEVEPAVEGPRTWIPFDDQGRGPRDGQPRWYGDHPVQVALRATTAGAVTVESWTSDAMLPFEPDELAHEGMSLLAAMIQDTYLGSLSMERPDPEDHEQLWAHGPDATGANQVSIAAVPIRDAKGALLGARYHLAVDPVGQPVEITSRVHD